VDSRNKVVRINSLRPVEITQNNKTGIAHQQDSLTFSHLPAQFGEMKSKGKLALQPLLQAFFDNIDDALFELADRADQNAVQNMYFESMREIRIKRRSIEAGFNQEMEEGFKRLLNSPGLPPLLSDEADIQEVDRLALVDHEELEELVATDAMIAKAVLQFADSLQKLTNCLDILIDGMTVTNENNPLGPFLICHNFVLVCRDLDLDIKAKLVLFKIFDRYVMGGLEPVYVASNEAIVTGEMISVLEKRGKSLTADSPKGSQAGVSASEPVNSPQKISDQLSDSNVDGLLATAVLPNSADVFSDLQHLLHQVPRQNTSAASGLVSSGQAPLIPREKLMDMLQTLQGSIGEQFQGTDPSTAKQSPQPFNIQQSLNQLLTEHMPSTPMSISQRDEDAVNLVSMLFQFILDDRNLAAPMKALIARLQLPIVKVAMVDKNFFSKGGHPARKLLNEIAHASLGWSVEKNIDRDPLYSKVSEIVNRLLNDTEDNVSIFHEVLADFIAFLEMDSRRTKLVQQRTLNAEDGKAKSEVARSRVREVLNGKIAGKSLPKVVIALLEEAWSNVLFLIYLKDGEEHSHWKEALALVDELLWSVEPLEDAEARQRLIKMIPEMLHDLRSGLTTIAYNPFDMNQLFADLENIHLAQLQSVNTVNKASLELPEPPQVAQIEKTLDQMLEAHVKGHASLEDLDAELDAQLEAIDDLAFDGGNDVGDDFHPSAVGFDEHESQLAHSELNEGATVERVVVQAGSASDLENDRHDDDSLSDDDPALQQADALSMGSWVEIHQEDGKKYRCRLAAVIRSTGKYVFVNRSGMKVAEHSRQTLAIDIKRGLITVLDEGLLFDRALESVIGNLRDTKGHTA